ncbi:MAG: hypothetical protein ACYSW8_28840, partial [Planctomycetota bacterium]
MADLHIKRSGAWSPIENCYIKISDTWTQVQRVYVKTGSAWKQVWENLSGSPNLAPALATDPANAEAGWRLLRDGSLQRTITGTYSDFSTEWGTPESSTVGDGYWVRATKISGIDPNGTNSGFGTWLQLNATREWSHLQTTIAATGPTKIKLELATDSGGSNIVATG